VEVAKNQAVDLIKKGFVNEGIALATQANIPVATVLALANNKFTGPIIKGAGNEFANLGYDLTSNFPLFGNQFGNIYDAGLNLFGINRQRDEPDPPVQLTNDQINQIIQDEEDLTKPPVVINQPNPQQDFPIINQGGGQGGNQGGGGGGNVVIGSSFTPPSTNVQQETNRIKDILDRRSQGSSQGFNMGGLATVAKYLKGR